RGGAEENTGGTDLSRTGDADCHQGGGLHAWPSGSLATVDGCVESQRHHASVQAAATRWNAGARLFDRVRRADLQADRRFRRIWFSGIAFRLVCVANVFFELSQMSLAGGVHRGADQ